MIGRHALATAVQLADLGDSLYFAHGYSTAARLIESDLDLKQGLRAVKFAFLNRACELACTPVHLRPVETAQGVEMAWYTYSPRACDVGSLPNVACFLGYDSSMTETEARSRAMGW